MNDLEKYFRNNNKRVIAKWNHYFDIYERHFSYYDSVLVVEKAKRDRPYVETTGEITVSDSVLQEGSYTKQTLSKIKYIRNYYRGYLIKHIFLSLISRLLNLRGGK